MFQSTVTTKATPTAEPLPDIGVKSMHAVTSTDSGLPLQVSSMYSKPQAQNGFSNALDLANVPQMRMGGAHNNRNFVDFSLTQPDSYHSVFPSEFGFGASMQFGFPSIQSQHHSTTAAEGMAPISVFIPPPLASSTSTNADPSGMGAGGVAAGGDSFTDFFPALLSENPLNGDSQEGISAESGKKSVGDLFNLTAGLDVFEDSPVLERNVNRDIGEVDMKTSGSIESSWNQPLTGSNENSSANESSLQANEEGSPFVRSSKEANETIVSEESVNSTGGLHPLGRMDSFGFTTLSNSEAPGFDASVNTQKSTTAPTASNAHPNWPNFDQIPSTQTQVQTGTLNKASESSKNNNNNIISSELNVNTQSSIQSGSTKVKGDQKVADRARASPKGKKKRKKGAKSSSNEASSRSSGNGTVNRSKNIASVPPPPPATELGDASTCTSEDVTSEASITLTEELVSIEERKPRSVNYSLSSSSTPTLAGVSSVAGFRSEGHTPPINTTEVTVDLHIPVTTSTTAEVISSLQPFSDVVDLNGSSSILPDISDLHSGGAGVDNQPPLEREIDDIFDGEFHDVSKLAATFGKIEGRSSLLSSIMAARATTNKSKETDMIDATGDVSTFKSSAKVSVFERIKDIEDDSSQESHENDQAEELTGDPLEGSEAVQQQYNVNSSEIPTEDNPMDEIAETTETTAEQLPQALPNDQEELLVVPDAVVEPAMPDTEPDKQENPASENEKLDMLEERDPVREDTVIDNEVTVPIIHAGMLISCMYCARENVYNVLLILSAVGEEISVKSVVPSESKLTEKRAPIESSVDPDPQP